MDSALYANYLNILEHELVPALGCTEPIAIAYAAAKARQVLGEFPDSVEMSLSGNIKITPEHRLARLSCMYGAKALLPEPVPELLPEVMPEWADVPFLCCQDCFFCRCGTDGFSAEYHVDYLCSSGQLWYSM